MIRVINEDKISWEEEEKEILAECKTMEEAEKVQTDHYYLMTSLEKQKKGKWVKVDGVHDKLSRAISEHFPIH